MEIILANLGIPIIYCVDRVDSHRIRPRVPVNEKVCRLRRISLPRPHASPDISIMCRL